MPKGYQTSEDFQTEEKLAIFLCESVRPDFQQIQRYFGVKAEIESLESKPLSDWIDTGISQLPPADRDRIARSKKQTQIQELKKQIGEI